MAQTGMEVDGAPGRTEIGSRKNRQADLNVRGAQRIQRIFKAKIMAGGHAP